MKTSDVGGWGWQLSALSGRCCDDSRLCVSCLCIVYMGFVSCMCFECERESRDMTGTRNALMFFVFVSHSDALQHNRVCIFLVQPVIILYQ